MARPYDELGIDSDSQNAENQQNGKMIFEDVPRGGTTNRHATRVKQR